MASGTRAVVAWSMPLRDNCPRTALIREIPHAVHLAEQAWAKSLPAIPC